MYPLGVSGRCVLYTNEGCMLNRKARHNMYCIQRTTSSKAVLLENYSTICYVPLLVAHIVLVALSQAVNSMQILAYLYIVIYLLTELSPS
jgi:hypothetical protein